MSAGSDGVFVSGATSVRAVLSGAKREVYEVYHAPVKKTGAHAPKDALVVTELARVRKITVSPLTDAVRNALPETARTDVVALVGERVPDDRETVLEHANFLACLYGIEDPYNLGDALRSLYAAGCDGVFLPKRDLSSFTDILVRASAGASELINLCVLDESGFLELLDTHGITPVCARFQNAIDLSSARFPERLCLFIGGEKRGIPRKLDASIPFGVKIDYARSFSRSLSASAAAAVFGFAVANQRKASNI